MIPARETLEMTKHVDTTTATRNAKVAPVVTTIAEADAEQASYMARRQPILDQLQMLATDRSERVSPNLVEILEAHRAAYVERDLLREIPPGNPGHEEWEAECERLDDVEQDALLALLAYEARRPEDLAYRAKYLLVIDPSSDIFMSDEAGPTLLRSMANAVNPSTSAMMSATYPSTSESMDPEVRMSWLMRAYRDAAMLIDPTIRGCWVGNNVNFTPEGGTTIFSVAFDRGEGLGMTRRQGDAGVRRSYLTDDVEMVTAFPQLPDLSALSGVDLHTLYSFYSSVREHFELIELGDMGRASSPAQAFIEQWVDGVFGVYADIGRYAVSSDRTDLNNLRARYLVDFAEGPIEVTGPGVPDLGQAA